MASTSSDKMPRKLWEHPDPKSTVMWRFMQEANKKFNLNMQVSQTFEDNLILPMSSSFTAFEFADGIDICSRAEANAT